MMRDGDWSVVFSVDDQGTSPVEDFVGSLDDKTQRRFRQIVFLHGFQKKTQKTPRAEIETAQQRMEHFIRREGGDL